jgi:hypothetical protein
VAWKEAASHFWLSSIIRADDVIWGDQTKDGKTNNSVIMTKSNGP